MALELRHIDSPEDLERWTRAIVRPFFAPGGIDARIELNQRFFDEGDRRTLAEIDAVIAGTFCSFDTMMSMPGGPDINVNAITGVTVQGTHRRRGVLTKMMLSDLANAHERGQAAAILFSAEYPIYGRFGFGVATRTQSIKVNKHRTGFARPASTDSLAGAVQYCTVDELHAVAPELFEVTRSSRGAEIGRTPVKWELECGVTDWPDEPWKGWQPIAVDRTGAGFGRSRDL